MRHCTRRMRPPVPFFSSPLLALQVAGAPWWRATALPARPLKGPQGQSQTVWAKQLAQKFLDDSNNGGQRYGGKAPKLCEQEGFPAGSIALG